MTEKKSMTDDERLVVKIYELALAKKDPCAPVNLMKAARLSGVKEKAANTIVKLLAQANFVKKVDDENICLTERGCVLAQECIQA